MATVDDLLQKLLTSVALYHQIKHSSFVSGEVIALECSHYSWVQTERTMTGAILAVFVQRTLEGICFLLQTHLAITYTQLVYERRAMLCIISYYRIVKELRPKLRLAAQRCLPSRSRFHLPLRPLNKQMKDWCFKQHQARTDMLSNRYFAQQINPHLICCTTFQAQHFRPGLIRCATNQARPDLLRNKSGQTQPDGWSGWKKQGFSTFFAWILPSFLHFVHLYTHNSDILKRNWTQLAFFDRGDH